MTTPINSEQHEIHTAGFLAAMADRCATYSAAPFPRTIRTGAFGDSAAYLAALQTEQQMTREDLEALAVFFLDRWKDCIAAEHRAVVELHRLRAEYVRQCVVFGRWKREALGAMKRALESVVWGGEALGEWSAYAGQYFQEKWNLRGDLARAKENADRLAADIASLEKPKN